VKNKTDILAQLRAGVGALRSKLTAKKHVMALTALALVFVLSALLPLHFIDNRTSGETDGYVARAALFAEYWSGEEGGYEIEKITEPSAAQLDFCSSRFDELVERCRVDRAKDTETKMEGSEYVIVRSDSVSLQLCRKWLQYSGDWNSWLDVCFDMSTGEVFYLYTNGECIYNSSEYSNVAPGSADAEELAHLIADEMDFQLYYFDESLEPGASSTAVYLCDGAPLKLELSVVYYEGRLFDVKIVCIE